MINNVISLVLFVLVFHIISTTVTWSAVHAEVPRPRGVSLEKSSLYYPQNDQLWQCLDGMKNIKYSYINDDYCDCLDGSDEPGTAACLNGTFHCTNKGYHSLDIPSSRVNDGICDCCDGSDEYATKLDGQIDCKNTCYDLGYAEQKRRQMEIELHRRGANKRAEMINKGKHIKQERENRRFELEERRRLQEVVKKEKEDIKNQAEAVESEAIEVFNSLMKYKEDTKPDDSFHEEATASFTFYDKNNDGYVDVAELQVDVTLDQDRNGVVTVKEAKYYLDERDRMDLETFIELSWPRIKPMKMLAQGIFKEPAVENEEEEESTNIPILNDKDHHKGHPEASDMVNDEENSQTTSNYDENAPDEDEEELYEGDDVEDGVGTVTELSTTLPEYDPETQRLINLANEARTAHAEAERELRDIDNEIKELEKLTAKDYGPEDEYTSLEGECYKYQSNEYIYTLCPFERASQQGHSGGSETTLGRWDEWLFDDVKKYSKQKYSHGASCWNGPQRSVIVQIKCGLENRIAEVSEPNRCEYHFDFETPAACNEADVKAEHHLRDEL